MNILPYIVNLETFFTFAKEALFAFRQKENKYKVAVVFDILCIALILIYGVGIQTNLISPLSPYQKSYASIMINSNSYEVFGFAPGWSFNKLNKIDYNRINTIAYFDVPVNPDGTLNRNNDGYITFKDLEFSLMADNAHAKGAKVVITLSQTNPESIKELLNSEEAQKTLINEAIEEVADSGIDGVTIDFEYYGSSGSDYQGKFNRFIARLTNEMHTSIKNSQVSVAVSASATKESMYDLETLGNTADRIFLMAYTFAVTEAKDAKLVAPEHGHKENEYWNTVLNSLNDALGLVPAEKLVLETAWYGNGDNYPLYMSDYRDSFVVEEKDINSSLDRKTIESVLLGVPAHSRDAARKNVPLIAKALEKEGILSTNVLAYALATIEHETAGTFEPIEEYSGRKSARRLGYEGGTNYFGRGFIQLTHLRNYKNVGERIGLGDRLVKNPELALNPEISAHILAAYFKDFGIARLADNGDFVSARKLINPDGYSWWIANLANKYLNSLYI